MDTTPDGWHDDAIDKPQTLLKYNVHKPFQALPVENVKEIAKALALPLGMMLFNLTGDINVGMCIRTAAILGCSDIYIVGRRKYDRRSEVGAKNYIALHRLQNIDSNFFRDNKLVPILLEQGGVPLESFSFKPFMPNKLEPGYKVVFIAGSEADGLPKGMVADLKAAGAPLLSISQYGVMRSMNVSTAVSIILYEYTKQWSQSVAF
jgi:tRNA G18 (ribose-2'-O)-methylase SpoU